MWPAVTASGSWRSEHGSVLPPPSIWFFFLTVFATFSSYVHTSFSYFVLWFFYCTSLFHVFIYLLLCHCVYFRTLQNYCIASPLPVSEVPDSNLGPETANLDWGVLWFCLVPPGKFSNSIWNQETIASFHIYWIHYFLTVPQQNPNVLSYWPRR